jgi:Flp pilus assembly protein TadD
MLGTLHRYEDALFADERALALAPDNAAILKNMAVDLCSLGQEAKAEVVERRAQALVGPR